MRVQSIEGFVRTDGNDMTAVMRERNLTILVVAHLFEQVALLTHPYTLRHCYPVSLLLLGCSKNNLSNILKPFGDRVVIETRTVGADGRSKCAVVRQNIISSKVNTTFYLHALCLLILRQPCYGNNFSCSIFLLDSNTLSFSWQPEWHQPRWREEQQSCFLSD